MPAERPHTLAACHIPHAHSMVEATTRHPLAVGTPGDPIGIVRVRLDRLETGASGNVPDPYGPVITAAGQLASIGGKGEVLHIIGMPFQDADQRAAPHVPQLDRAIPT